MINYLPADYSLVRAFQRPQRRTRSETIDIARIFKTAPKLSAFFREEEIVAVKGDLERPISGFAIDSRRVMPGNVFFAIPGLRADGNMFIDEAVSRGAVAVVVQKMPIMPPTKVTYIRVVDVRRALAGAAKRYYKSPDVDMTVIGVTGTHGKTSVSHLIKHLLSGEEKVGMLGTVCYDLGARVVPSYQTTPESLDIYGMLAQMRTAGCKHAVLEVSSHGLDQQRVRGVNFGVAVFTNLSSDHLDYHKTVEAYFDVKSRLFTGVNGQVPKVAVVNLDDPHGQALANRIASDVSGARLVTFGENPRAQVRAEQITLRAHRARFKLVWPKGEMVVESPLVGRYHVSNVLAATATAWALGRDPAVFLAKLRLFKGVPGRMERVEMGQPFNVLVDYAHTADAFHNALGMLRAITPGKVRIVFGCGGNRDRTLRASMLRVAQDCADQVFVTADNPRTEALTQIFSDMKAGETTPEKVTWINDRRGAIAAAIAACQPGDCLLIAGKGHEIVQECGTMVFPFDDRQVARELLGVKANPT